jgi:hypothetical protein
MIITVRDIMSQGMGIPRFPILGDTTFLIRWGAQTETAQTNHDASYHDSTLDQIYYEPPREHFTTNWHPIVSEEDVTGQVTKAQIEATRRAVIEMTVTDWDNPQFGLRLAEAYQAFGVEAHGTLEALPRAYDYYALGQLTSGIQQAYPTPFEVVRIPETPAGLPPIGSS